MASRIPKKERARKHGDYRMRKYFRKFEGLDQLTDSQKVFADFMATYTYFFGENSGPIVASPGGSWYDGSSDVAGGHGGSDVAGGHYGGSAGDGGSTGEGGSAGGAGAVEDDAGLEYWDGSRSIFDMDSLYADILWNLHERLLRLSFNT